MKILNYTLILLFALTLCSCGGGGGDEGDTEKPKINFTNLSSTETSPTVITGNTFTINITLTDNINLKSVSFDRPTGVKTVVDYTNTLNDALTAKESSTLTGMSKTIEIDLDLTSVENSKYTIVCHATDASGNTAEKTAYFKIQRP